MEIVKINETGLYAAVLGISLSFHIADNTQSLQDYVKNFSIDKYLEIAKKLANKGNGHNKFLQMMNTIWMIRMPRFWWSQFDTYRHAIQGVDTSVASSESTMHTLLKRPLKQEDFHMPINNLDYLNKLIKEGFIEDCKNSLPEGFLQTRVVSMNYEVIRNIIIQRKNHKLAECWGYFIKTIMVELDYPEILDKNYL